MSQMLKTIWSHEKVKEVKSVLVSVEEVKDVKNDLVSRSGFEAGVVIHWSFRIVSRATALSQEK